MTALMINPFKSKTSEVMLNVLIVDDDDHLRRIYARYLGEAGFKVHQSDGVASALEKFKGQSIDVILLDIQMPESPDKTLLSAFKITFPSAKIMVASCHTLEIQKEILGGADNYFNKTEGCRALLSKIQGMIQ